MPQFVAVTSNGLTDVLADEVASLGFKVIEKNRSGVTFESNWEGCYRANLELRTATRILKPVLDFPAYNGDDLYHNLQKHDFTKYIRVNQTLAVDAAVRDSSLRDQRFVAMKAKDAIVDQFREKFGSRPDVDTSRPDLRVMVRVVKSQVNVAIDTSGEALSYRGYRTQSGEAPLREHLAAGLLALSGWQEDVALIDPMCGSGTILIEAAMRARKIAPGSHRKRFAFQNFLAFQPEVWDRVVTETLSHELAGATLHLYGFDRSSKMVQIAQNNAVRAGVDAEIRFATSAVDVLTAPADCEPGVLIVNPPYGERMGVTEELKDVYRDLAFSLKRNFKNWTCWILSGNETLTGALKLKARRRMPVFNGNIECRFLEYKINA